MPEILIEVPGRPVPWERVRTKHGRFFKPKRTRAYEDAIAWTCRAQKVKVGDVECELEIEFCAEKKLRGDIDNYAKCVLDGLQQGGMIVNDKQVRRLDLSFGDRKEDVTVIRIRLREELDFHEPPRPNP